MKASIIIPVRDLLETTRRCLDSVRRNSSAGHEVLVVDNASRPTVRDFLRRRGRAGELRVLRNNRNRSFAASINQAIPRSRGELLVWLNNDAVVGPEWLERLSRGLRGDPRAGAAGPCTNDPLSGSGRGRVHAPAPDRLDRFAAAWALKFHGQSEPVGRLSGFCLALKRTAFENVGPLDERFVWGEEDEDYSLRLRQAGYRLLLARDVFVHHDGGATRGAWSSSRRKAVARRNQELFREKWEAAGGRWKSEVRAILKSIR